MAAPSQLPGPPFAIGESGPLPVGTFALLAAWPDVTHGVTTRDGPAFGDSSDDPRCAAGARHAAAAVGAGDVAWVKQVHGGAVLAASHGGLAGPADALVTATPGLAVLGRSADCPLVLVAGRDRAGRPAVGFAHASWRSTVAGIAESTVARLVADFAVEPDTIVAAIGPSAGPCCYEVGPEVRAQALAALGDIAARYFTPRGDRWHFDLWTANVAQLRAVGVPSDQIVGSGVCTLCQGERFWSWRREGVAAGRFAALIAIRP